MKKSVAFTAKPTLLWEREPEPKKPMRHMTVDIDADLHLRMKLDCARRGVNISDEIRGMLEERWPVEATI